MVLLGTSLVAAGARAQPAAEAPGAGVLVEVASKRVTVPAPPALDFTASEPLARLPPAAEGAADRLEELRAWNREGRLPARVGFSRALPRPRSIELSGRDLRSFGAAPLAGGLLTVEEDRATWAATLEVEGAHALRARFQVDDWPTGTVAWTRGERGIVHGPFGSGLVAADGSLRLPPVEGSRVSVEITVLRSSLEAGETLRVRLDELSELVDPRHLLGENALAPAAATSCEIDGQCVGTGTLSVIDDYRHAVARLLFDFGAFTGACTGTLINDTDALTDIPYLWTANHCISDQATATSLVAYFDYFTDACDGDPPSEESVPQVAGSTLLATGETSDFTLLQLPAFPSGFNYLMGWTTRELVEDEILYMLSHPEARRQAFSTSGYTETPNFSCGVFEGLFYAEQVTGSTLGGSSGASVIVDASGGQIVGELLGACSPSNQDWCDYSNFTEVDGAFRVSYPSVAEWLDPPLPTLSVTAIDETAGEPSEAGAFRITRSGDLGMAAQVTVNVSGDATPGVDYQAIASPVTIPAGAASADVPLVPLDDVEQEGNESVTLEIVSSPGYDLGSPSSATIFLGDDEGPGCASVVVADQSLASGTVAACNRLHAGPDLTVSGGGDVRLASGVSVVFYEGFSVGPGASLSVSSCGQDLCRAGTGKPSSIDCHPCVAQVCAVDSYCCDGAWDRLCTEQVASECGLSCS